MRLHDLKPSPGATKRRKRLGRGESSGLGKTAGRGHKGHKSRSGPTKKGVFEGGQLPLYRRLPKRGFNNAAFHKNFAPVNVGTLEKAGLTEINESTLREAGLVNGRWDGIKILGDGDLTAKLTVTAHRISASAREKIEKAGGTVEIIETVTEAYNRKRAKKATAEASAD